MPKRKVKEEDAGDSREGNATPSEGAGTQDEGAGMDSVAADSTMGGGKKKGGGKEAESATRGLEPPRRVQKNPGFLEVFLASTLGRALTDNSQVDFLGSWLESTFGGQKSEEPLDLAKLFDHRRTESRLFIQSGRAQYKHWDASVLI